MRVRVGGVRARPRVKSQDKGVNPKPILDPNPKTLT